MNSAKHPEYVDARFESLMFDVDQLLRRYVAAKKSPDDELRRDLLYEICRRIRTTKLHFQKVIERYGADYEDSAAHLVDIAYAAVDQAADTPWADVRQSLSRHAEEIEQLRAENLDRSTS